MIRALRRYQLITDIAVAAAFFALGLPLVLVAANSGTVAAGSPLTSILVHLGMSVALALRRLIPSLALLVAWLASILQMLAATPVPLVSDLAVFAVLYTTARYGSRRVRGAGLVSVAAGSIIATLYLVFLPMLIGDTWPGAYHWPTTNPLDVSRLLTFSVVSLVALFALFGFSYTLGFLARTLDRFRESRRARAAAEQRFAAEEQRNRIARDMHDVVAHSLTVVIAQAEGANYIQAIDPAATSEALKSIAATARDALADVRVLLAELRADDEPPGLPSATDDTALGRPKARPIEARDISAVGTVGSDTIDLNHLLAQFRSAGISVERVDAGAPRTLTPALVMTVYRIAQEALTNVLRHGDRAEGAELRFDWLPSSVALTVTSTLTTTESEPAAGGSLARPVSGHGLIGMRERAAIAGGSLDIRADDGRWIVRAELPLASQAAPPTRPSTQTPPTPNHTPGAES